MWYCYLCNRWINYDENHFHNYTGCVHDSAPITNSVPPINDDLLRRIEKIEKTLENMKKA